MKNLFDFLVKMEPNPKFRKTLLIMNFYKIFELKLKTKICVDLKSRWTF